MLKISVVWFVTAQAVAVLQAHIRGALVRKEFLSDLKKRLAPPLPSVCLAVEPFFYWLVQRQSSNNAQQSKAPNDKKSKVEEEEDDVEEDIQVVEEDDGFWADFTLMFRFVCCKSQCTLAKEKEDKHS